MPSPFRRSIGDTKAAGGYYSPKEYRNVLLESIIFLITGAFYLALFLICFSILGGIIDQFIFFYTYCMRFIY
jgi:hypothetical protein